MGIADPGNLLLGNRKVIKTKIFCNWIHFHPKKGSETKEKYLNKNSFN